MPARRAIMTEVKDSLTVYRIMPAIAEVVYADVLRYEASAELAKLPNNGEIACPRERTNASVTIQNKETAMMQMLYWRECFMLNYCVNAYCANSD